LCDHDPDPDWFGFLEKVPHWSQKSWIPIRIETNADSQRWLWIYFSLLGDLIE
jgi:hypothetical protein